MGGLSGKANFAVQCNIPLPVGPPALTSAQGTFNVVLQGSDSDFQTTLEVSATNVVVGSAFPIVPTISYAYSSVDEHFLFDSFVRNYFETTLAQGVSNSVQSTLTHNVTDAFIDRILEVTDAFTSLTTTLSEDVLNVSLLLRSGTQILPLLGEVVPKLTNIPHPEEDGGSLSVLSVSAPPFDPTFCSNIIFDVCSAEGVLTHPIPTTAVLQNCTMCVKQWNDQVILGVRYVTDFVLLGNVESKRPPRISTAKQQQNPKQQHPATTRSKKASRVNRFDTTSRVLSSNLNLSTAFYIGIATLTQPTTLANTQTQAFIENYAHATASGLSLPYLDQCQISHEALHFVNAPSTVQLEVIEITVRENPNHNGSAVGGNSLRVLVAVNNLPQRLITQRSAFSIDCGVDVDLPMNFTTAKTGNLNVSLTFADEIPVIEFELLVDKNAFSLYSVSTNLTTFSMATTYVYVFDPYGQYYAHTTLLNEMANEFHAVMVKSAGDVISSAFDSFFSPVQTNCPLKAVNLTHVVAITGSACASDLPQEAPVPLGTNTMWYVLNSGVLPAGIPTSTGHSPLNFMPNCTDLFPLGPFQQEDRLEVQFVNCSTYGTPYNGNLVIGSYGELPISV
jgi:hypothetical protein